MNTSKLNLVMLILVICFSMLACGVKGGRTNTETNGNSAANAQEQGGYPQEVKDEFLKSCVGAGSNAMFCACMLDKVQSKYSLEEFTTIESKITAGSPPEEFVEFSGKARAECLKKK